MTSASLHQSHLVRSIADGLGSSHYQTFSGIGTGSPRPDILAAAEIAIDGSVDMLVAVGGGSVIDAAKLVQLCIWQKLRRIGDLDKFGSGLRELDPGDDPVRTIAVPTTMSAAEFASLGGAFNLETGRKEPFDHPLFVPLAICADPAALAQSPIHLTVSTGIRTVDHCVERFCSNRSNPFSDALALGALRLLFKYLRDVHDERADSFAYGQLQLASWMSMNAVNAGVSVGASHAIGRVLGAVAGVPHGQTSAILLPAVIEWNDQDVQAAQRQRQLGEELRSPGPLWAFIGDFIADLGQPRRLSNAGVRRDQFSKIAHDSMIMLQHPSVSGNLRNVTSEAHVIEILERAW